MDLMGGTIGAHASDREVNPVCKSELPPPNSNPREGLLSLKGISPAPTQAGEEPA
jgi:hypothetical protein